MKHFRHFFLTTLVAVTAYATSSGQASLSTHNDMDDDIFIRGMKMAPDGGTVYTGYREDATLGKQMVLVRSDIEGNIIWQKEYGSTGEQQGWDLDFDGFNVYVVGTDDYQGAGGTDIFVMKFGGLDGSELWTKPTYLGGSYDEQARDIVTFSNGDVVIAGSSASYTEDAPGNNNKAIYCARLNKNGVLTWETALGGKTGRSDWANAVVQRNNVITLTGGATSWSGSNSLEKENIFMLKLDGNGNEIDFRHYGTSFTNGLTSYYTETGLEITQDDTYYYVACFTNYYNTPDPAILRVSLTNLSSFSFIKYENPTYPSPGHDMLRFEDLVLEGQDLFLTGRGYESGEQVTFVMNTDLSLNLKAIEFYDLADDERGFALSKAENGELTVASRTTQGTYDELELLRIHPHLEWEEDVACTSSPSTAFDKVSITLKTSSADPAPSFYGSSMSGSDALDLTLQVGTIEDHIICSEFSETFQRKYSNCFDGTSDVWQPQNYYSPNDLIIGHNDKITWVGSRVWQHLAGQSNGDAYPHAFFSLMDDDGKNVTHLLFKATDVDDDPGNTPTIDLNDLEDQNDFLSTWAKSINPTDDGGYIVLGQMQVIELNTFNQFEAKHKDLLVIKLNSSLQIEWASRVGNENASGDFNQEYPGEAIQVRDINGDLNGYMLVGSTQNINPSYVLDKNNTFVFMAGLDMSGGLSWAKTIFEDDTKLLDPTDPTTAQGSETKFNIFRQVSDHAEALIQTGESNDYHIYITGRMDSYPGTELQHRSFLARFDVQTSGGTPNGIDQFIIQEGYIGEDLFYDSQNSKVVVGISAGSETYILTAETDITSTSTQMHFFSNGIEIENIWNDPSNPTKVTLVGNLRRFFPNSNAFAAMQVNLDYANPHSDEILWARQYPNGGTQEANAGVRLTNSNFGMIGYTDEGVNACSSPNNTADLHALFVTANGSDGHSPGCENIFKPRVITNYYHLKKNYIVKYNSGFVPYLVVPTLTIVSPSQASGYSCHFEFDAVPEENITVSIETLTSSELKSYPNPFNDYLHVDVPRGISVRIFDLNGKVVYTSAQNQEGVLSIETSDWVSGIYTIEMADDNGREYGKVMKQ